LDGVEAADAAADKNDQSQSAQRRYESDRERPRKRIANLLYTVTQKKTNHFSAMNKIF